MFVVPMNKWWRTVEYFNWQFIFVGYQNLTKQFRAHFGKRPCHWCTKYTIWLSRSVVCLRSWCLNSRPRARTLSHLFWGRNKHHQLRQKRNRTRTPAWRRADRKCGSCRRPWGSSEMELCWWMRPVENTKRNMRTFKKGAVSWLWFFGFKTWNVGPHKKMEICPGGRGATSLEVRIELPLRTQGLELNSSTHPSDFPQVMGFHGRQHDPFFWFFLMLKVSTVQRIQLQGIAGTKTAASRSHWTVPHREPSAGLFGCNWSGNLDFNGLVGGDKTLELASVLWGFMDWLLGWFNMV